MRRLIPVPRRRLLPVFLRHVPAAIFAAGLSAWVPSPAAAENPKGDIEYGEWLAGECVTCHQPSGDFDGIPPIVGWPEDSFVLIMKTYQDGARDHDVMRTIANRYNDEDLWSLAAYFASLGSGAAQ